jgi:hypothetical protein
MSDRWDRVIEGLQTYLTAPKPYKQHAEMMLKLIPELRQQGWAFDVTPVLSHGTLQLLIPDVPVWINIWGNEEGHFTVYLYDLKLRREMDEVIVDRDHVVTTLEQYTQRLRLPENV